MAYGPMLVVERVGGRKERPTLHPLHTHPSPSTPKDRPSGGSVGREVKGRERRRRGTGGVRMSGGWRWGVDGVGGRCVIPPPSTPYPPPIHPYYTLQHPYPTLPTDRGEGEEWMEGRGTREGRNDTYHPTFYDLRLRDWVGRGLVDGGRC